MELHCHRLFFFSFLLFQATFPADATSIFPEKSLPTKSGYLPINKTSNSSMFFAFYEALQPTSPLSQTPLLIWLQGGPGCSSMTGNFFEVGPYLISGENPSTLRQNPGTWNRLFGLVFVDNPIGTGFSIAGKPEEIPRNQLSVAQHLYFALQSFLSSNPSFRSRPLFLTGESYAGKYISATGFYILQRNTHEPSRWKINLRGVAIGNGLIDPATQVQTHAVGAYFSGLINRKQRTQLEEIQKAAVDLIQEQRWEEAADTRSKVLRFLRNATGIATLNDLRRKKPYKTKPVGEFLNREEVKEALGVEKTRFWEDCSDLVNGVLHADVMKSVRFMVEELLKRSRVLLYQGQFDLRDGVVSTEAWIEKMEWEELESFLKAERKVWRVNGELAGYVQRWGSLSEVVVAGAGHLAPADQGLNSQNMIEDWVFEKGLFAGDSKRWKRVLTGSVLYPLSRDGLVFRTSASSI